jgi:hypothetical protein
MRSYMQRVKLLKRADAWAPGVEVACICAGTMLKSLLKVCRLLADIDVLYMLGRMTDECRATPQVVPELSSIANLDLKVAFNLDSSRIGPGESTMSSAARFTNAAAMFTNVCRLCKSIKKYGVASDNWIALGQLLDANRQQYDAFLVVHGECRPLGFRSCLCGCVSISRCKPV